MGREIRKGGRGGEGKGDGEGGERDRQTGRLTETLQSFFCPGIGQGECGTANLYSYTMSDFQLFI